MFINTDIYVIISTIWSYFYAYIIKYSGCMLRTAKARGQKRGVIVLCPCGCKTEHQDHDSLRQLANSPNDTKNDLKYSFLICKIWG